MGETSADTLKREMLEHLAQFAEGLVETDGPEWKFDSEGAIYWFCNDWHEGGGSDRYSILSTSPYRPAPSHRCAEDESEICGMLYAELVRAYEG